MKKQLITEAEKRRMQVLAGIIKEDQEDQQNESDYVPSDIEKLVISSLEKLEGSESEYAAEFAIENIEMGFDQDELKFIVNFFKEDWKKIADYLLYFWTNEPDDLTFINAQQAEAVHKLFEKSLRK